jgi:DNA-binding NtrC family response regulator
VLMVQINPANRLTVLLADTADQWSGTLRKMLEPHGVFTVGAPTGREALRLIEGGNIHVAVLDQRLPQMTGMQVIKRMRDLPSSPPTILLADHLSNQLLHEALNLKVFSVVGKPVDFNQLLDSLARVLKRHYESRWPGET